MSINPKTPASFGAMALAIVFLLLPFAAHATSEDDLRQFLHSAPGTYGWMPVKGTTSYDFFQDGRLHVQGPDGEATMWEGTWKLKGDQLTILIPDLKTNKTYTVKVDKDELLLNEDRYRRYAP